MTTAAIRLRREAIHPVQIAVEPAFDGRNRLTTAFLRDEYPPFSID